MGRHEPEENKPHRSDSVGDVIHEVGDELVAVVSLPGEITYRTIERFLSFLGGISILFWRSASLIARGAVDLRETIAQMSIIGVSSVPIVVVTVAFSGMVLAFYSAMTLGPMGLAGTLVGGGVCRSIVQEIGPVLSAVVVAARAGSAMASEIGSMKVTEQIDAMRALAVDPVEYLVVPRLLASIAMLPVVTILADVIGTGGGYLVATHNGISGGQFLSSVRMWVDIDIVLRGLIKTIVFGAMIAIVGCYEGLRTKGGATGVGRATTRAVVISIILVYVANYFLAILLFGRGSVLD